ncbi:ABC transporter ATP-binding protein [Bosea sp. NBC_00550]|uniref:ABC transporter ATP-binding protein n=1 Tax=Bosea sp. NBC_00550 TaxID=2969621 RepID=UPI00222E2D4B|nr:ABC transporter ATP-binding protein [Bosea sp. NBC_00550]UZF95887.1 ABC transporter ATP-binding protein [Bosea sp. NBC_00550]
MSALSVEKLRVRFGSVEVLKSVDLAIESGEFIVLVGPSGCGKSTLLNVIAGLEQASDGRIGIGGREVTGVPPKDRDIAMVFQTYALYPAMTVRGNITFGMECRGIPKPEQKEAVTRVAKLLQIEHLLDRRPGQLSGGQRQRVAMGRALVRDPVLFLFDEPLSNLDAKLRVEMRMEIKRLHQRIGTTMVYVTHDQVEAMTLATRIAVMNGGVIQQFADPQTIYDQPANLFVARFMGSPPMNALPAKLVASGGEIAAMVGPDATTAVPLPNATAAMKDWVGRDVVLGIRPECITLSGDEQPARPASSLPATVEMIEPTGAETMALIRVGQSEIMARMRPDARPAVGSVAHFAIDTAKACLFDPKTESRIA